MLVEIIGEHIKNENKHMTSNQELLGAKWVKVQRTQTEDLNDVKLYPEFDIIWLQRQKSTRRNHNRAKQAHANTADPTTYPKIPSIWEEIHGMD